MGKITGTPRDLANPIHAYRHLLRRAAAAVSHAQPASTIARDALRSAFRDPVGSGSSSSNGSGGGSGVGGLDPERVKRTIWFLTAAAKERGLEHQVVKNMVAVRRGRMPRHGVVFDAVHRSQKQKQEFKEHKNTAYHHYEMTIAMLNETMGLCLPLK
ncbi:hypothetical protein N3K66_002559 [Trichothecium roseum]|uniref:Uncharacterized protein n=1 Tax=Trichothecium roseum TaxID=47278 RepID=A0ACC0V9U9_9HYPO|nr:hypothetical protein N3K66_002559 [Trichothecium roseum]